MVVAVAASSSGLFGSGFDLNTVLNQVNTATSSVAGTYLNIVKAQSAGKMIRAQTNAGAYTLQANAVNASAAQQAAIAQAMNAANSSPSGGAVGAVGGGVLTPNAANNPVGTVFGMALTPNQQWIFLGVLGFVIFKTAKAKRWI